MISWRTAARSLLLIPVVTATLTGPAAAANADAISDGQWFHSLLRTAQAHRITMGEGITVAVIDSGVDATHPDLSGSVLDGADLTSDGPGNGHLDVDGHGTGMAGLIAAHGRVRGIAPAARILPIRESADGYGTTDNIYKGVELATERGVDVISISLASSSDDPRLRAAVKRAIEADIVIVAGVGNKPDDRIVGYPAAIPGVVAVGGIGKNGEYSPVSVTGSSVVIAAPSDAISSTGAQHTWRLGTGTSDSTAIVAGAVALLRAKFPDLSAPEIVHRLTVTAVDKGPAGRDPQYGYGVLDIVAALTADVPPLATASPNSPAEPDSNSPWPLVIIIGAVIAVGALVLLLVIRSRRRG